MSSLEDLQDWLRFFKDAIEMTMDSCLIIRQWNVVSWKGKCETYP